MHDLRYQMQRRSREELLEHLDTFEDTVAAAMDEAPGLRVAIEPKPYEPAPNNIYRTTTAATSK